MLFGRRNKKERESPREENIANLKGGDVLILKDFQSLSENESGVEYNVLQRYLVRMPQESDADFEEREEPSTPPIMTLWEVEESDEIYLVLLYQETLFFYFLPMEPQNRHDLNVAGESSWLFAIEDASSETSPVTPILEWEYPEKITPPPFEELGQEVEAEYQAELPLLYAVLESEEGEFNASQIRLYRSDSPSLINHSLLVWEQNWLLPLSGERNEKGGTIVLGLGCQIGESEYEIYLK